MLGFSPLAAAPLASAGVGTLLASLAATEAKDTASISVSITASASFAVTEAQDVANFVASAGDVIAYLAATEAKDVAAFAANNENVYFALTEAPDVTNFNFEIRGTASFAVSEAPDVFEGYIYFASQVYFDISEAPDVASGVIWNTNAELIASEAPDIAAILASMTGTVSMAAIETPDGYSQNAYILWLTPTQPDDPTIWVPKNNPTPYLTTVI